MGKKLVISSSLIIIVIFGIELYYSGFFLNNYKEMISASLAFIGTVIALTFALIALPIQNIVGKYSQNLVQNISQDKEFNLFLSISLLTFGFNLTVLISPQITLLYLCSYILTLYYLVILIYYIKRVFYLLDIRNHIYELSNNIIKYTKSNSAKSTQFDKDIIDWLKNETELIFDIIQKAIQEDRYETVDSGFKQIVRVADEYISTNKDQLRFKMDDDFIIFILNNLINSKNLINVTSHPKIMTSLANSSGDIGKKTLQIDTVNLRRQNYFSPGFVSLLKDILLSSEMVKETSNIPAVACDNLAEIGKEAIDLNYPNVTKDIIRKLGDMSRTSTGMHYSRGDIISQYLNSKMGFLINYSFGKLDDKSYLMVMIGEINKTIEFYLEDEDIHSFDININPFTGPMSKCSISIIGHTVIERVMEDNFDAIIILEKILNVLFKNIELSITTGKHSITNELLENLYSVGIGLIKLLNETDDVRLKQNISKIIGEKIFPTLYVPMQIFLTTEEDSALYESLEFFTSLIGIIMIEDKECLMWDYVKTQISDILNLIPNIEDNSKLLAYPYIRLLGFWIFKLVDKTDLLDEIKENLDKHNQMIVWREALAAKSLPDNSKYYPHMAIDRTIKNPMTPYNFKDIELINKALFGEDFTTNEDVKKFEDFIQND